MNSRRSTTLLVVLGLVQLVGILVVAGAMISWRVVNPFRYLSDPMLVRLENPELILILGTIAYLFSTVFLIALLEIKLREQSRIGLKPLFGLLPVIGVASVFFVPTKQRGSTPSLPRSREGQTGPASIVVGLAGVMLVSGIYFATQIGTPSDSTPTISATEANIAAFSAVREIVEAQSSYKKKDWDGDGKKGFALFVVQLWRTGRVKQDPVEVDLIPEELAVARVAELAFQGYSFRNLHYQSMAPVNPQASPSESESHLRRMNYSEEWALIAEPVFVPEEEERDQVLQFMALSDGRVFAKHYNPSTISSIPYGYEKEWSLISSVADVGSLQNRSSK